MIVGFSKILLALSTYIYTWGPSSDLRRWRSSDALLSPAGIHTEALYETWSFGVGIVFQLF